MMLTLMLLCFSQPERLTYAAGYIPNIQFAPIYVAMERGYYREEGIDLKLDYTIGPDVLKLVAVGKAHIGSVDPDAFLNAVTRGLPVTHLATLYRTYPIALISDKDILNKESLKGKTVGITGAYGASYLGLKAMLADMGLPLKDIDLRAIGYTQVTALQQGRVDAVVGYVNNEPLRLKTLGVDTQIRTLDEATQIPGVGLMVGKRFLAQKPDVVRAFLRATFRGVNEVIKDPRTAYELVVDRHLPELKGKDRFESEYQILLATLPYWKPEAGAAYGQVSEQSWENLVTLLSAQQKQSTFTKWREWINRDFRWNP